MELSALHHLKRCKGNLWRSILRPTKMVWFNPKWSLNISRGWSFKFHLIRIGEESYLSVISCGLHSVSITACLIVPAAATSQSIIDRYELNMMWTQRTASVFARTWSLELFHPYNSNIMAEAGCLAIGVAALLNNAPECFKSVRISKYATCDFEICRFRLTLSLTMGWDDCLEYVKPNELLPVPDDDLEKANNILGDVNLFEGTERNSKDSLVICLRVLNSAHDMKNRRGKVRGWPMIRTNNNAFTILVDKKV